MTAAAAAAPSRLTVSVAMMSVLKRLILGGDGSIYVSTVPTGQQTYKVIKVKLILLLNDDQKTKKCTSI
jgi:hypothetical protein